MEQIIISAIGQIQVPPAVTQFDNLKMDDYELRVL